MINRRTALKNALFVVGFTAAVGHCSLAPRKTKYEPKDINPTLEQLSTLKLLSQHYDFLGLGDTAHRKPKLDLFAYNTDTIGALHDGGKKHLFIEYNPENNVLLSSDTSKQDFDNACPDKFVSARISNDQADKDLCRALRSIIENENINVTAIDQRLTEGNRPSLGLSAIPFSVLLQIQKSIYGEKDVNALLISKAATFMIEVNSGKVTNSTKTTELLLANYPEGGVILYGAAHFRETVDETTDKRVDMSSLIRSAGKKFAVVNLFETDAYRAQYYKGVTQKADMDMVVFPSAQNPSGVYLNNQALMPLYQQAMAAGQQPEASVIGLD